MIDEVIKGLPLHFQKENTIKLYKTLKPVVEYIDDLIENLKNQTSLLKCSGIFLDFMGERYDEKRNGRDDETYRQALIIKKMALDGLPNTEFLLTLTRELTNKEVTKLKTRPLQEVASQLLKINMVDDLEVINKMPDLNKVCEVGARMYWELEIINNKSNQYYSSIVENIKKIEIKAEFKLDQTMRINSKLNTAQGIGFTKIIKIGGTK
ncbi:MULTISPECIES: hypothetical protein [Fusobacterium]|jgi:hypothetical protein|uniref:Uncharacterized protein n=1 Tax=Fusobacterium nucleatum TaxID=851 RepID=A0A323TVE2_FUSNU|nr:MULTISPECIES: hypothetical protein [Fusobacterium]PCR85703.1 hypothetical protein CQA79_03330 [Fusobacterium nucleatum]PZA04515.1 hypothetical protein DNF10_05410 [Fusobacterium nucleatum]QJX49648.1 hypothetical protein HOO60_01720 [Fusobacterium nucleatum]HCE32951.1 hypothetical protein [Fusobacterium sp.]